MILLWAITVPTAIVYLLTAMLLPGGDRMRWIGCRREETPESNPSRTKAESRLDALESEWRRREQAWDDALRRYGSD